jgi:alkylation response protein AidB-like acyl-CoA dehydrogenase
MDLALTEAQEMLKNSAREFLERECPPSLVRAMEDDERGYPAQLWEQMAGLGWMGLAFPEEFGGEGGSLTDLAVLLEEMGRAMLPGPFFATVVNVGLTILDAGSDSQKQQYIPNLASGTLIGTVALLEENAQYSPSGINMPGELSANSLQLSGKKLFVESANTADLMMVPVRTGFSEENGITIGLVPGTTDGISLSSLDSIARDRQFEVAFNDVSVPPDEILGGAGEGWPILKRSLDRATALHCAVSVGGAQKVLEMTVEYTKQRVQFGRPIASFQSVQHDCADMVNAIDSARLATYQAIARLEDGLPADREIAMAKVLANHAYKWTTLTAQQLHGGIGFMEEYDLQMWTRRAKVAELKFGTSGPHREVFAQSMGLV